MNSRIEWAAFRILGVSVPETCPILEGYLEDKFIKAAGSTVINSSGGGKCLDWYHPTCLAQLWEPVHTKFSQTILANEGGALLRDRILAQFMDYREFILRVAGSVWPREE